MEPSTEVGLIPTDPDSGSEKNDVQKCKHFSMRKYVSEMRQKDARKCWPFRSNSILFEVPKDALPPLDVPKYRWWRCPHCLPQFWDTATEPDDGAVPDASCVKCKFGGPFTDSASLSEAATVASTFRLMLHLDMADAKDSNPSISLEVSPRSHNTSVLCVGDKRNSAVPNHLETIKDVDTNNEKREPVDKYATQGSNSRELPSSCDEGPGNLAAANAENASDTVQVKKKAIDRKATKACENEGDGLLDIFVSSENRLAPAEPDRRDSPSSDSSEVGPYMTSSLCRRKAPRVRLLTDLLAAVDGTDNKHIRKDNAPLLAIGDASRETRNQTIAEEEMETCENVKKAGLKNKRKLAAEDSIKCCEGVPKIQKKENRAIFAVIAKNSDVVPDSQPEGNGFTRIHSQSSKKNNLPEHHVDEASNSIRKKKRKNKINGNSSEMKPNGAEIKYTCSSSDGKEFTGREVGITLSSVLDIRKNTDTCFLKEKTNLPPTRPDQVPVIPRDIPSCPGHPHSRMDFKMGENHPASEQFQSAKPSSAVNGTCLLPKCSLNASSEADRPNSEVRQGCSLHGMEDAPFHHGSDAFRSNGVHGIVNDGIDSRILFLSDSQRYSPNMVDSQCLWTPNLGISGASKKKKAIKHQEHVTVLPQCRDKSADPGNPDDIPMEIVELMAKHQHERRLQDAEMENCRRGQNLWLEESSQHRKFPENRRDVMTSKDFRPSTQKSFDIFSDLSADSYKVSQLERYHTPPAHHTFFQAQGLLPKFQPIGGSSLANTLTNKKNKDYSSIKASDGNFLSLGVSGMWYPPKHNEALVPRVSSMRPDCMPFAYSSMPQSCGLHSNGIDFHPHGPKTPPKVEMCYSRDPKIFTSRPSCLQKPEKDFNFEAYRRVTKDPYNLRHNGMEYERRVASFDVSSNETIPAMHLLSLMDARMHSGKKIRLDEDAQFAKQPSLPCEYHSKEVCGLHLGMCKAQIPLRNLSFDYNQAKALPAFSPPASLSQPINLFTSGSNDGKPSVPLDVTDKGKGKCYEIARPIGSSGVLSFLSDSAGPEISYGFNPYHSAERNFPSSSEARIVSPYQRMSERETIEARNGIQTIRPPRSGPDSVICTLNRNPAEFSVPEEGNVYSIGRDDLKLAKRVWNKPESSNAHCCGGKKMAKAKHAAGIHQNQPQIA